MDSAHLYIGYSPYCIPVTVMYWTCTSYCALTGTLNTYTCTGRVKTEYIYQDYHHAFPSQLATMHFFLSHIACSYRLYGIFNKSSLIVGNSYPFLSNDINI